MNLKTKMTISIMGIVMLLVAMGGINVFYLLDINSGAQSVAHSNIGEVKGAANLSFLLSQINADMSDYLLSKSISADVLDTQNNDDILNDLEMLRSVVDSLSDSNEMGIELAEDDDEESGEEEEKEQIEGMILLITEYQQLIIDTLEMMSTEGVEKSSQFYILGKERFKEGVMITSRLLYEDAIDEIEEEASEVILAVDRAIKLTIIFTLLAFVGALVIGLFMAENITRRLLKLKDATSDIKNGNFDVAVEVGTEKDEIASLMSSFNHMAEQLKVSTTSIGELESEIERRVTAELQLQTSHKELESRVLERTLEFENAKIEAETANRSKSEFLANMSHELRTPLNHIIGFTELIADEKFGPLNDIQKEYLGDSLGSGKHLLTLINDILDLSKVEAGKLEVHPSELDIQALLKKCMVMFKEKAMKHRLNLELEVEEGFPGQVTADKIKMKQIFYNLVSNAVKFTPDGGHICLKASVVGDNKDASQDGESLVFSIIDTGIGIEKNDLLHIFNPFVQSGNAGERSLGGTGLGLTLTKKFIELHGGEIKVSSKGLNQGTNFTFTLPQDSPSVG